MSDGVRESPVRCQVTGARGQETGVGKPESAVSGERTEAAGGGAAERRHDPIRHFGIVILAAGASTRMGTPKQLLPFRGRALLLHAVEAALASPAWPVVVVLGAHAEQIRPVLARVPVLVTENAAWSEGMAASLRAGIATLQQFSRRLDAAILALCDQPAFSPATVDRLLAAQRETGRSIVAARYGGRNGAPALFLREHFPALLALTGEEGARTLLNSQPERVATVELPEFAIDLDTPADALRAQF